MEENKKEQKVENPEEKRMEKNFWIIGIAIIIFLLLILGSVVLLKNARDKANNLTNEMGGNNNNEQPNYIVSADGTKENVNKNVTDAEFVVEGRKFYDFRIVEKDGLSTVEARIENTTDTVLQGATFKVRLLNSNAEVIKEYVIITTEIQPKASTLTVTNIFEDCSDAESVEVVMVNDNQESGE